MSLILRVAILMVLIGCKSLNQAPVKSLDEAKLKFQAGELYEAKKFTETFLQTHAGDMAAQKLMAEIIDQEIVQHKEVFQTSALEELPEQEKSSEARTWLERAKSLMELGQYDEAVLAAEKVFLYEPNNLEASQLIDKIKQRAIKDGKQQSLIQNQILQTEIQDRIRTYRSQARDWINEGRWGAARLAVEKMLLLSPEDPEALSLIEEIRAHQIQVEREKRKTL